MKYRTEEWDADFFKYLKSLEKRGKAVVLGGDLNVAHHDVDVYDPKGKDKIPGFTPEERQSFGEFLTDHGYVDSFRALNPDT